MAGGVVAGALLGSALAAPYYIILIIRAPIMRLRRPAITLRAMVLRQVVTRSPTAHNASDHTIREAELISGRTAIAIHALERCKMVTCKTAVSWCFAASNGASSLPG